MNVKQLGEDTLLLTTNHGDEVLYYREQPVAGHLRLYGYFALEGHSNKWAEEYVKEPYWRMSAEEIEQLFL